MVNCAVSGCKKISNKKNKEKVKYFVFPKNKDILRKWIQIASARQDKYNLKNAKISLEHFISSDRKLKEISLNISEKDQRLKTVAIQTKNEVSDQKQSQQKRKAKCLTKDILFSNNRFRNESHSEEPVDGEIFMELDICDAKINNKETQTEVHYGNSSQLKIIVLQKKLLLLEKNNENILKELQDANSLNASISKIFNKEQIKRLTNPNKEWDWTAEDIYSIISSHLSLLLQLQPQQKKYPQNLQSSSKQLLNQNLPINIISNSCSYGRIPNTSKPKFKCDKCNMIFNCKSTHTRHVKSHKKQNEYHQPLQQHDNSFSSSITTRSHSKYGNGLISTSPSRSSSSSLSTAIFQGSSTDDDSDLIQSKVYRKTFTLRRNLNRHNQTYSDEKCCVKPKVHRRVHTKGARYQCDKCGRGFEHSGHLNRHMKIHTDERPLKCSFCDKTFIQYGNLVRHVRKHTGEKPFECEFCHKKFTNNVSLQVHRRIHTKEEPYKCDECGGVFKYNNSLNRHMKIHTGERPHKCSFCDSTFTRSSDLVIHTRRHTGERPFKCPVEGCGKCFMVSKQLKLHSHKHTEEKL